MIARTAYLRICVRAIYHISNAYLPSPGDGNCMFRSIADQLGSSAADAHGTRAHEAVRAAVVAYMRRKRDLFAAFVEDDEGFDAYLDRMRCDIIHLCRLTKYIHVLLQ